MFFLVQLLFHCFDVSIFQCHHQVHLYKAGVSFVDAGLLKLEKKSKNLHLSNQNIEQTR